MWHGYQKEPSSGLDGPETGKEDREGTMPGNCRDGRAREGGKGKAEKGDGVMADEQLAILSKGRELVLSVRTIKAATTYAAQADAVAAYAKKIGMSEEIQREAVELSLRFKRKAGELIKEAPKAKGAKEKGTSRGTTRSKEKITSPPTLAEQGIDHNDAHLYQKLAAIPEARFEASLAAAKDAGAKATASRIITGGAHVGKNTGENEWYTPAEYADAARDVMGWIDLDPASTPEANAIIKAKHIYTVEDDGLTKRWKGRVWLNPPYAQPIIGEFAAKLVASFSEITAACVLVNNATETKWFQQIVSVASAVCFPSGRVRFWYPDRASATPLQGQAVIYCGADADAFCERFASFGFLCRIVR